MKKIEPLQSPLISVMMDKINEIADAVNTLMPTESPKPDWVKEEIAVAKRELERVRGYLEILQAEYTALSEGSTAHLALSCLANVETYLGRIGQRPNDDLLWKAYRKGADDALSNFGVQKKEPFEVFQEWLKTLPPDTLKADRELVKSYPFKFLSYGFERHLCLVLDRNRTDKQDYHELKCALKRLCGMEVEK